MTEMATDGYINDWWQDLPALPTPWERRVTMMRARIDHEVAERKRLECELARRIQEISEMKDILNRGTGLLMDAALDKDLHAKDGRIERLEAENAELRSLRDAVLAGDKAIEDAYAAWDSDRDMRVGKILGAMMGSTPGYREDTDTFSEAVRRTKLAERQGGA